MVTAAARPRRSAVQVLAAVAASVALLALVRPSVVQAAARGPAPGRSATTKLVGQHGVVVERGRPTQGGQVRIGGEIWTARPYDDDLVIEPGDKVDVFEIRGATALVHAIPELDS